MNLVDSKNIAFIVGVGRSGTSLLHSMLGSHPKVSFFSEIAYVRRFVGTNTLNKIWDKKGTEGLVEHHKSDKELARLSIDVEQIIKANVKRPLGNIGFQVYKGILDEHCNPNTFAVVDKDPKSIEYVPLLQNLSPRLKVINIIRDPRDVLASKRKAAWSSAYHSYRHIFACKVQMHIGHSARNSANIKQYHFVFYEELISNPSKVLAGICSYLGLPWSEKMLDYGKSAEAIVSQEEMAWKQETLNPIIQSNSGNWKTSLTKAEIKLVEKCCIQSMRLGEYEFTDHVELTFREMVWYGLGFSIISLTAPVYILYQRTMNKIRCRNIRF